jgi:hypothetical protein
MCEKEDFTTSIQNVRVPASSTIFEFVKKLHLTMSVLDKKYARQTAVLTKVV